MKVKIIERNITNEDGDFYGVCGNLTRLGAYRIIKRDLKGYGIDKDIIFKPSDLVEVDFCKTVKCPTGIHTDWIWWGDAPKEDEVEFIGKGWGFEPW